MERSEIRGRPPRIPLRLYGGCALDILDHSVTNRETACGSSGAAALARKPFSRNDNSYMRRPPDIPGQSAARQIDAPTAAV
jgi:hypothetical protein